MQEQPIIETPGRAAAALTLRLRCIGGRSDRSTHPTTAAYCDRIEDAACSHRVFPALLLVALVFFAGRAIQRVLRTDKGLIGLAVAPAIGLATFTATAAWSDLLGAPLIVSSMLVLVVSGVGVLATIGQWRAVRTIRFGQRFDPLFWACVALTALLPVLIVGVAIGRVQAPLSPDDGALHVEVVQALRTGQPWKGWYPPGLHALLAAELGGLPWLDSAQGVYQAALGLAILAPTLVLALGLALWRRSPLAASAAGVLTALTFTFPYSLQIWAGWPLAAALLLVLGLWTVALGVPASARLAPGNPGRSASRCHRSRARNRADYGHPGPDRICRRRLAPVGGASRWYGMPVSCWPRRCWSRCRTCRRSSPGLATGEP